MLHWWDPPEQLAGSFLQLLPTLKKVQNHLPFLLLAHFTRFWPSWQMPSFIEGMLAPPLAPPFAPPLAPPLPPLAPPFAPFAPLPLPFCFRCGA